VAARLVAVQDFEAIPRRHHKILRSARRVDQPQLPLHDVPDIARDSPSGPRVSFSKQVCGRVVRKRLNHT
jgi:hypothetical protein